MLWIEDNQIYMYQVCDILFHGPSLSSIYYSIYKDPYDLKSLKELYQGHNRGIFITQFVCLCVCAFLVLQNLSIIFLLLLLIDFSVKHCCRIFQANAVNKR